MKEDPELAEQLRDLSTKELIALFEGAIVDHHTTWSMVDYKKNAAVRRLKARKEQIRARIILRINS